MPRFETPCLPTCTCSEAQLEHVGCDCRAIDIWMESETIGVEYWQSGYAADDQRRRATVLASATDDDIREYVKRKTYGLGRVFAIHRPKAPTPALSAEEATKFDAYARTMSARDNS